MLKLYVRILATLAAAILLLYATTALFNLHSTIAGLVALLSLIVGVPAIAVSAISIGKTFAAHIHG